MCQGRRTEETYGRHHHHPRAFTIWMAGDGRKAGTTYGDTDDFVFNFLKDPVHVHDLHPTMLHLLDIGRTSPTTAEQHARPQSVSPCTTSGPDSWSRS